MCVLGGHLAKINFAKMACAVEKELFHYSGSMRNEKDNFVYHSEEKKNFLLLLSQRLAQPKKLWCQSNVWCILLKISKCSLKFSYQPIQHILYFLLFSSVKLSFATFGSAKKIIVPIKRWMYFDNLTTFDYKCFDGISMVRAVIFYWLWFRFIFALLATIIKVWCDHFQSSQSCLFWQLKNFQFVTFCVL